ncbi:MAG: putative zinc-binding metallopeptidase [Pseudomonadota bacterium]
MKRFHCRCGLTIHFDDHVCVRCGRQLAFDATTQTMVAEEYPGSGLDFCSYRPSDSACNWIANSPDGVCLSCRSSRIIPALSKPENRDRWRTLERAKRRLLYDLMRQGLPVDISRMHFAFKEDRRTNPDVDDDHVLTGHDNGLITINAAEADDVYREQMRVQMGEPYRSVLGHFRHESGHFYFHEIVPVERLDEARALFGDERAPYDPALRNYYENGPAPNWPESFISGYASAHPAEDWAECWAHYLHMQAALETAYYNDLIDTDAGCRDDWQQVFIKLALALNGVQRSLGLRDAYPFVITSRIAEKLAFVHDVVQPFSRPQSASVSVSG